MVGAVGAGHHLVWPINQRDISLGLITFFWGTLWFTRTSPKEFQDFQTENSRDVRRLSAMFVFGMLAMVVIIVV